MCEAVKAVDKKEFESALTQLDTALELFPNNKEARFYRITVLVAKYQENYAPELLVTISQRLSQFVAEKKNEHMLYYFCGILGLYKQEFMNALNDFEQAINLCDNVVAKYYIGRARCYACLSMFKEAINDLTVSIDANDSIVDAYILRGKCAFISGDTKQAFSDFQHIIKMHPDDPMMHIHAANILMASGVYQQAIKAYTNAYKIGQITMALFGRAKCHVAVCNIPQALADVSKVVSEDYTQYEPDLKMLKILNLLSQNKNVEENTKVWEQALENLDVLINSAHSNKSKDILEQNKTQLMDDIELTNTGIFTKEDFLLYRAIANFYLKQYKPALQVY